MKLKKNQSNRGIGRAAPKETNFHESRLRKKTNTGLSIGAFRGIGPLFTGSINCTSLLRPTERTPKNEKQILTPLAAMLICAADEIHIFFSIP